MRHKLEPNSYCSLNIDKQILNKDWKFFFNLVGFSIFIKEEKNPNILGCPKINKIIPKCMFTGEMAQIGISIIMKGHFIWIYEYFYSHVHHWLVLLSANVNGESVFHVYGSCQIQHWDTIFQFVLIFPNIFTPSQVKKRNLLWQRAKWNAVKVSHYFEV